MSPSPGTAAVLVYQMNYIPLEAYKRAWIFRHKDLPVSEADLDEIKPLSEARAEQVWRQQISQESNHPEFFYDDDWANKNPTWQETFPWQNRWESDEADMPEPLLEHLDWDDNTLVYFCYDVEHVIETRWHVFKRHWKNFLFFDNGPLLIGRKRKQIAQFMQTGNVRIGTRP